MPAPLRVVLTDAEDLTLTQLRYATTVPHRTRDRAHMIRLNAQGWNVPALAKIFECHEHTVRAALRRWENNGLGGLWETAGRGAKCKWHPSDLAYLEQCLEVEARTYNSLQLSEKLAQQRNVQLSPDRLRRVLKKKGWRWKRTCHSHKGKQDPEKCRLKQADLDTLKQAAVDGYLDLKYLDESGCCRWSPVSYSYSRSGSQKQMAQVGNRKGRISILGLWEPQVSFEYALVQGGFKTQRYLEVMDWIALRAATTLAQTGRITVIVQDNGSSHTSNLSKQRWPKWHSSRIIHFSLTTLLL